MKILMFSLFTLLLSFMPLNNNTYDKKQFIEEIENGYNAYYCYEAEETESYYLQYVIGDYDEMLGYSIYFEPKTDYSIEYHYKNSSKTYHPTVDYSGKSMTLFIVLNEEITIEIKTKGVTTKSIDLEYYNLEHYQIHFNKIYVKGNNEGFTPIYLESQKQQNHNRPEQVNDTVFILSIVFTAIIFLSIIIILVLAITKKGLFNNDKLNNEFKEEHEARDQIQNIIKENPIYVESEEIIEEEKEVYQKSKQYEDEETRDISLLLQEKGFNTNYKELDIILKNEIMLELMMLRNNNEITEQEYKNETIKLWMK